MSVISPQVLIFIKLALTFIVIFLFRWLLIKTLGGKRTKDIMISCLVFSFSLFVSLVISEFVVRVVYSDVSTTGDGGSYFTSRWIKEHPPRLNSFGFREREIMKKSSSGIYRIAIVGDSLTYGQGIKENDRLSNILENRLNKNNRNYEVYNFGRSGAETIDHNNFLRKYVLSINPDYILLQWYVNDFEGHDKSGRPSGSQYWRLFPSDTVIGYLTRNSALFYIVNKQWRILQKKFRDTHFDSYSDYLVRRFKDPKSKDSIEAVKELQKFINESKKNNIPVGMIVYSEFNESILSDYPLAFMLNRVLDICAVNNITCLDMRPIMGSVKPHIQLWANKFDGHPNLLANTLAADAVIKKYSSEWNISKSINQ